MSDNMATKLKRKVYAKKFTGYVLLGAIGLVFVFFGFKSGDGGLGMVGLGSVARVNDTLISAADFDTEEKRIQEYYSRLFGGSIDFSAQRNLLRQQAIENLVRTELVAQAARKEGILSTDAEVREFIVKDIPAFQENGQFMRDRYMGYLQSVRSSPGDFEGRVRKDIASLRTRHLVELASAPLSVEDAKLKELQSNKLNVNFLRLDANELAKNMRVPAADVAAKLADPAFVKKANEHFELYRAEWSKPETVKAQHILIMARDEASAKTALAKITEARKRADKEDFGKLASQLSEDPGSKAKNGQLEAFSRGQMVKEFEDVAFTLKPGEISQPVKTQFGYHIIKVNAHDPGHEAKFDDVKNQVAERLIARDHADAAIASIGEAVTKGDEAKLNAELTALNAKWEETGDFALSDDAVPRLPAGTVADAAFEVSAQAPLLRRVVRDGSAAYILKFKGTKVDTAKADANAAETLRKRRADGVYGGWLEAYRQKAHVSVNAQVMQQ